MSQRVVTLLFTDLEQSTRSWLEDESAMADALARHDAILRSEVERAGGRVLKHTGDGMVVVFEHPLPAARTAVAAQRALRSDPDAEQRLRTRMALHTGPCTERDGDLFGPTLNRTARILGAAHGGQVIASAAVEPALRGHLPLADLGVHRLRDLLEPEPLHQVVVDDLGAYPPLRSLDSFDHNLPAQRTRLIGREDDVATVRDLLSRHRLVTLTGIGGVGKTRLALEVAARDLDARSGAVFADLAPVAGGEDVIRVVASAAGLPSDGDALVRLFVNRPMLLVLDNCEHVLDACADLAETLLDQSPSTAILATSREPLGIDVERVWRVPSLTAPADAVELFAERARAVGAELDGGPDTQALVAAICERLDGIPLAIELAASRTSHLSVTDIAARLEERFQLLTGGSRRSQPRHQTLQAMLDWSYDLLDDAERRLLRQASVFVGGFTLSALESVAAPGGADVLDRLASLVDRSLVVVVPAGRRGSRYRLLETVRLYALDRLAEAGESAAIRDRHHDWARGLLLAEKPGWPQGPPDLDTVDEQENILAALDWTEASGDLAELGRLATAALVTLGVSAWTDESWRHFDRPEIEEVLAGEDLAQYLAAGAATANALGDFPRQAELAERARAVAPERGGPSWRTATGLLANALSVLDPPRGELLTQELLSAIPPGHDAELGWALGRSADGSLMVLDLEEGARRLDAAKRVGSLDLDLGLPDLLLGRLARAHQALRALEASGPEDTGWTSYRIPLLAGLLAAVEGRFDDAVDRLVDATHRMQRLPVRLVDHDVLNGFAVLDHHLGDHERAAWLLAVVSAGPVWGRSPGMYAVHMHYRRLVREHVDRDAIADLRSRARGTTVASVLREEVLRHRPHDEG